MVRHDVCMSWYAACSKTCYMDTMVLKRFSTLLGLPIGDSGAVMLVTLNIVNCCKNAAERLISESVGLENPLRI